MLSFLRHKWIPWTQGCPWTHHVGKEDFVLLMGLSSLLKFCYYRHVPAFLVCAVLELKPIYASGQAVYQLSYIQVCIPCLSMAPGWSLVCKTVFSPHHCLMPPRGREPPAVYISTTDQIICNRTTDDQSVWEEADILLHTLEVMPGRRWLQEAHSCSLFLPDIPLPSLGWCPCFPWSEWVIKQGGLVLFPLSWELCHQVVGFTMLWYCEEPPHQMWSSGLGPPILQNCRSQFLLFI